MTSDDQPKPYRLTFEKRPGYLYALVQAEHDSYDISRGYWQEIADECLRSDMKKVLVEEEIPEEVSVGEAFQIGAELLQMGFEGIQIAFVDRCPGQEEINNFSQLVAI